MLLNEEFKLYETMWEVPNNTGHLWYTNPDGKIIDLNDSSALEKEITRMLDKCRKIKISQLNDKRYKHNRWLDEVENKYNGDQEAYIQDAMDRYEKYIRADFEEKKNKTYSEITVSKNLESFKKEIANVTDKRKLLELLLKYSRKKISYTLMIDLILEKL